MNDDIKSQMQDTVGKLLASINSRKESIVRAFVAETGCLPSEAVLIHQTTAEGAKVWIRLKTEEEMFADGFGWQPIQTDMKSDGEKILLYDPSDDRDFIGVGYWDGFSDFYRADSGCAKEPTHWQRLPKPPKGEK